jgi:hypothetical protein
LLDPAAEGVRAMCKVLTKTFEGARYRLVVEAGQDGGELIVAGGVGSLAGRLEPGDVAGLTFEADDVHVVPAE